MKTNKLQRKISLILFQIMVAGIFLNAQTITENFDNNNFKTSKSDGSFTGVGGIVWKYESVESHTYKPCNAGDFKYAAMGYGGALTATFTKKISQIAFRAWCWPGGSQYVASFEVYVNNRSKGTLSFTNAEGAVTKSISLTSGCDTNVVSIRLLGNIGGSDCSVDDVAITMNDLLPADTLCNSPWVSKIHCSFGNDPKTQMIVSWITPAGSYFNNSSVSYGETTSYGMTESLNTKRVFLTDTFYVDDTILVHHVTLSGLKPGTKYHYRCGGSYGLNGDYTIQTAPANSQPFTYAVIADPQYRIPVSYNTVEAVKLAKENNVSFVISLGDNVDQGGTFEQWFALLESMRNINESTPFMVTYGSHDGDEKGITFDGETRTYKGLFQFPDNGAIPENKNLWYSFEYSNCVFTSMYCYAPNLCTSFMDSVYKHSTKSWKFSYWHYNLYSTSGHGMDGLDGFLPNFLAVADTYNLTTVFSGHGHGYEWTHPISKVGNPPVLNPVTISNKSATAERSQGTTYYTGAGLNSSSAINSYRPSQPFTLTGDSAGGDRTLLLATVYDDSVVYKVVYYMDCKGFKRGDVVFTYKIVEDNPVTKYTLTVNSGSGDGDYASGIVVNITADTPPSGKVFDIWTGDVSGVTNVNAFSTMLTMVAANATVTATYKDAPPLYTLTVTSGTGSGNYTSGTIVNITANVPAYGKVFDKWTGDITGAADVNASATTITMPAANTNITATYKDAPPNTYTLTVTSGTGSGNYTSGTVVNIVANIPVTGKVFDKWTGDVSNVANINTTSTTITMPAANVSINATYKDALPNTYTLSVTGGTGSGNYTAGTVVNISANAPVAGKVFDKWTGDVTGIADVNASSTTITIPNSNITITVAYKDVAGFYNQDESVLSIFPNPVVTHMNIYSDIPINEIKIFDLAGKPIYIEKSNGSCNFILSADHIEKGLYIIEIFFKNGNSIHKSIVIQ